MEKSNLQGAVVQAVQSEVRHLTEAAHAYAESLVKDTANAIEAEVAFRKALFSTGTRLASVALEASDAGLRQRVREQGHRSPTGKICYGHLDGKGRQAMKVQTLLGSAIDPGLSLPPPRPRPQPERFAPLSAPSAPGRRFPAGGQPRLERI